VDRDLTILDCTFRDGGYYNSWDFDYSTISEYLNSIWNSGVDIVEIGFRFLPQNRYLGPFAYSTDRFLKSLDLPDNKAICVMINAADFLAEDEASKVLIRRLFSREEESPVDIVRIAAHFSQIGQCEPLVKELKSLGYRLGFNCMQSGGKSSERLSRAASEVSGWGCVDILYFADSLGNMTCESVEKTIGAFRESWNGEIGFHGHDNRGRALVNSLAAIDAGASWIDGTILGMGRGAGNTRTESLLLDLNERGNRYNHEALYNLSEGTFKKLQVKYNWGMSLSYHIAAINGIHPTYVQEMKSLNYDVSQMRDGLKQLGI